MKAKALTYSTYGGPEVLEFSDTWVAEPGPGQVRVRVAAGGLNPIDGKLRAGVFSGGLPLFAPVRTGSEFSGVVDAVGEGITRFAPGDEVVGSSPERWAHVEAIISTPANLVHKPANVSWEVGAGISSAGQAAFAAMTQLGVRSGDTVLVHGAAGGVGSNAVQLALHRGAKVIGTASPANHDYLRSLGVVPVAYGDGLADRLARAAPSGVTSVLDLAGGDALTASLPLVDDPGNRILTFQPFADPALGVPFFLFRFDHDVFTEVVRLHGEGVLDIPVHAAVPFAEARRAHELLDLGHARGKIVLRLPGI